MNCLSKRLFIVPLLLLLIFFTSGCGNQTGLATKDIPATVTFDADKHTIPATKESVTREAPAIKSTEKETPPKETPPKETFTKETSPKVTSPQETTKVEAPAPKATPSTETPETQSTVTISITGDEKKGVILEPTTIDWQEGDSVLDVLKRVTKSNRIPLEYRGSGLLSYVEGIANLYEFDQGASSGWLFKVNGKFAAESAGAVKLSKGDSMEWIYSLELSEVPDK